MTGADPVTRARARARTAIARGERLFNTRPVVISGVTGLNEVRGPDGLPRTRIVGTCHNTPTGGGHSSPLTVNIGIADAGRGTADIHAYQQDHRRQRHQHRSGTRAGHRQMGRRGQV